MNILPLILALVLMLAVLTVEKMEKFKNQTIVQKEYQAFLKLTERQTFNKRQEKLFGKSDKDLKQLSFRFFVNKATRDKDANVTGQYRTLNIELMKFLYKDAKFFTELKLKRENFLEELMDAIEKAADNAPEKLVNRINDIARLDLGDPDLQRAFYHMLKGTVTREQFAEMKNPSTRIKEKSYVSLFYFLNYNGEKGTPTIEIQKAPREILNVIFNPDGTNPGIVDEIIAKRQELAKSKDNGASDAFKNEFSEKRRPGIDDKLLNFKITSSDKTDYK